MTLTSEQLQILRHSLGQDQYGDGPGNRDWFGTRPDGHDGQVCQALCRIGLMRDCGRVSFAPEEHCYRVTPEGRAAVERAREKRPFITRRKARSKERYDRFLRADSGMTFLEWIRRGDREYLSYGD